MLLFKESDAWTREREVVQSVASLALILPSLVSVVARPPVLPVRMPPTHPSVAIGALGPRVHLASSSVSVELSPTATTIKSLNMPAVLFRGYEVTEKKRRIIRKFTLQTLRYTQFKQLNWLIRWCWQTYHHRHFQKASTKMLFKF